MTQQLMLSQSLEGHITIRSGETAVIHLGGDAAGETTIAVNFLRSGIPAIQFMGGKTGNEEDYKEEINNLLKLLRLSNEKFTLSSKKDGVGRFFVLTLTRKTQ